MIYIQIIAIVATIVAGFLAVIAYIKKDENRITKIETQLQDTRNTLIDLQETNKDIKEDITKLLLNVEKIKTIVEGQNDK